LRFVNLSLGNAAFGIRLRGDVIFREKLHQLVRIRRQEGPIPPPPSVQVIFPVPALVDSAAHSGAGPKREDFKKYRWDVRDRRWRRPRFSRSD
jgi:hypothetical protein